MKRDFCVTFDLWETLLIDRHELDEVRGRRRYEGIRRVLSTLDIDIPLDDLRRAYEKSANYLMEIWRRNDSISVTDQIRMIIKEASGNTLDLPKDHLAVEKLQKAYVEPLFEFPPKLNSEAITTLEGMRSRVRRLGLISNTGRSPGAALRELIAKYGILKFFDVTIFSDEVGSRKPDRRIFQAALSQLGATAERAIHVGDDPDADIRGAKEFGMRAILFDYPVPEEFKDDPTSLFALTRANHTSNSRIEPDAKVASLKETLAFVDSLT